MNAETIASKIIKQCTTFGLDLNKLLGQGYDGCSTMTGSVNGVQAQIRSLYPKAAFVHCASHRLNLVVNDLNAVVDVRNAIGTIKAVVKFFRESTLRRSLIPNVPLLCETRWSEKYKSIRLFSEKFSLIHNKLKEMALGSINCNNQTRQKAHQLLCAVETTTFVISMLTIAKYSALLEPVAQAMQGAEIDLLKVQQHIQNVILSIQEQRDDSEKTFDDIFDRAKSTAEEIGTDFKAPRFASRQIYRSNTSSSCRKEHFRKNVYVPYLDSILSSLKLRFAEENSPQFALLLFHPLRMANVTRDHFINCVKLIDDFYDIENLALESNLWFDIWAKKDKSDFKDTSLISLLKETEFYPAVRQVLLIALTLPSTSCTFERSFSTLRRVKTWLRSTMTEDRTSGLCMMSVHRQKINSDLSAFIEKAIDKFASVPRRIQLLFSL